MSVPCDIAAPGAAVPICGKMGRRRLVPGHHRLHRVGPQSFELQGRLADPNHALHQATHLPHSLQLGLVLTAETLHHLLQGWVGTQGPLESLVDAGLEVGVTTTEAGQLCLQQVQSLPGGSQLGQEVVPARKIGINISTKHC